MEHEIILDLLPLYHDGVCSEKSRAAVEAHLKTCPACRAALSAMDAPLSVEPTPAPDETAAVRSLSRAWEKGKRKAWWICSEGHVWKAVISARTGRQKNGCPVCAGRVKQDWQRRYQDIIGGQGENF